MTKTELKQNITKINKLLRSDSYEAGIELIKTLDDPVIKKGTLKEVLKHPQDFIKLNQPPHSWGFFFVGWCVDLGNNLKEK